MTITPSMSSHKLMVAFCRLDPERFAVADLTREQVQVLLPLWCGYAGMTDDERADVLAAYPVGDPEPVPGVDYFPEQVAADAAVIVAETLAETDWSLYGPCDYCNVGAGEPCMFVVGARAGRIRVWPHPRRREVTARPAEVWDDSVPPGGYVCAVCRVPVESEPCPEHGTAVA